MPRPHLSLAEREVISQMSYSGAKPSEIGKALGRHRGTISREIARNTLPGWDCYYAHQADWLAELRRSDSKEKFVQHSRAVWRYVKEKLKEGWSPEQIAGRMREDFPEDDARRISHETIYAWIREEKRNGGGLWKCLRQSHRKRRKRYGSGEHRGQIKDRVGIENRPTVAAEPFRRLGERQATKAADR